MSETSAAAFMKLVDGRRGHFRLESGHHSGLWLDLDPLFRMTDGPLVAELQRAAGSARWRSVSRLAKHLLAITLLSWNGLQVSRQIDISSCSPSRFTV